LFFKITATLLPTEIFESNGSKGVEHSMPHEPHERIFGVETEFGCLVIDEKMGKPEQVVEEIKNHLFFDRKVGAIDYHARDDVFEPAQSGGFLMNGARLYIDAVGSHLEYATAECRNIKDLIANDRAGQRLIVSAIKELGLEEEVCVYNNSVDHFGGHTFGCHENYLVKAEEELMNGNMHYLYPFLVTRQIFAGVGRVGGHVLYSGDAPSYEQMMENPIDYIWVSHVYSVAPDPNVKFQLSQRADHILKTAASRVRFNRALINPKWETMYTENNMTRLHMLFGEGNQNEYAYALKIGTTLLAIRVCEDGLVGGEVLVQRPLEVLRSVSRDETFKWECEHLDGVPTNALEIQWKYLEAAKSYRGENEQTDWILAEWERTLNDLKNDPMQMGDRLDWVAKKLICEQYMSEEGLDWSDDALQSVDLEYHNIDPTQSLFYGLEPARIVRDVDIMVAQTDPPQNTRAKGRGKMVEAILKRRGSPIYAVDWNGVHYDRARYVSTTNPFDTYENPVDQWENPIFGDQK
jgi:proteasome accessory factor A